MQPLWDFSREANQYLGSVVVLVLLMRLIPMVLDRQRWRDGRASHTLAWFLWICFATANATAAAFIGNGLPSWTSGTRLLLNIVAICLCMWWPHPLRYVPIGADRDGP